MRGDSRRAARISVGSECGVAEIRDNACRQKWLTASRDFQRPFQCVFYRRCHRCDRSLQPQPLQ